MSRIVVVAPLRAGTHDAARRLIEQGPPFDPASTSLTANEVYVTDREAVFLFEGPDAKAAVAKLLGEPDVWRGAAAWRDVLAERPRLADAAFSWARPR